MMKRTLLTLVSVLFSAQLAFALVFGDNLNRPDNADLGANFTPYTGLPAQLVGNKIRPTTANVHGIEFYTGTAPGGAQYCQITISTFNGTGSEGGCCVRCTASASDRTGYFVYASKTGGGYTTLIDEQNSGVGGASASENATTWVAGDVLTVTANVSVINVYRNQAFLLTLTDATITTGTGGVNMYTFATLGELEIDDFLLGDLVSFVNAGTEGSGASGDCTAGAPASPANDDVWILVHHGSDQVAVTADAAWTQIAQGNGGGTTSRLAAFWFRYAGSTPSLVVSHSGGQSPICGIAAFRGARTTGSPINAVGSILGGTDASMETNSVTPTKAATMVLALAGAADDNNHTAVANYSIALEDSGAGTNGAFVTTAGNPDGSVGLQYTQHTSGATNPTITQAAADPWATLMVALERAEAHLGQSLAYEPRPMAPMLIR